MSGIVDEICLRVSVSTYVEELKKLPAPPPGYCFIPVITGLRADYNGKHHVDAEIAVRKMNEDEMKGMVRTVVEPPDLGPFFQVSTAVSPELMLYLKENTEIVTVLADQIVNEIKKQIKKL